MFKFVKKSKNCISLFKKNVSSYMSSLPTKRDSKRIEDFIKDSLLSTFKIDPDLKTILEDEDTQDESIKSF